MQPIYLISYLEPKKINSSYGKIEIIMGFNGVYRGNIIKTVRLRTFLMIKKVQKPTPCLCKIIISQVEKTEIIGTLESIKYL
ncbi:hypothetical protein [Bacteriovorax sp. Seq25_V]|uniref:hypothetical protein n=1 Tax=Bacteriovorax sp. Seq25_V TaxID=1201288 RepID=UPI00038A1A2F|nr:hypothetical protein [Bacteriovorax sp. Seq25_V]EQC43351.1 hypothetical protein M900_0214 [Bacteriovorax sp. Seq25_V]